MNRGEIKNQQMNNGQKVNPIEEGRKHGHGQLWKEDCLCS